MEVRIIVILKLSMPRRSRGGFTLIEMLVVLSIIGLLTAVLVANFMGARDRAEDSQKIQDLNAVKNALRLYYNDNQRYPVVVEPKTIEASKLGTTLVEYIKDIGVSGAIYQSDATGDTFTLKVLLDAAKIGETESFVKCGVEGVNYYYMVCAN